MLAPTGFGLGSTDQLVPFHRSTNVWVAKPEVAHHPTAKQLVVLAHDTPVRLLLPDPAGCGVVTSDQLVPFQCSTRLVVAEPEASEE